MLELPNGTIYKNDISKENSIMNTDIDNYDDFICECKYIFVNCKNVNKVIYKDNDRYYEITKEEYELMRQNDEEKETRTCTECNKEMTQGYCIESGEEYYCSDECLHKHYTQNEYLEMYDNGNGES